MRGFFHSAVLLALPVLASAQANADIRMASWQPGTAAIAYPMLLASAAVVGVVDVRFVVDALGQVDTSSIVMMKSTHELFSHSVRAAVVAGYATNALIDGTPRRQAVVHRFVFAPAGEPVCLEKSPRVAPRVTLVCAPRGSRPARSDAAAMNLLAPTPKVPLSRVFARP